MINLQINQKHMINATIFYKNMASKYMVRDSLLTVLCNGCVNSYTSIADSSSYIFNKLVRNLKFC